MPRFQSLQDWLSWQEGLHPRVIDLGLERAAGIFKQLNPENNKPLTITVAGTNGKGSCIAFLDAIYRAAGYKVGCYTSPHILEYNERIKIDGLSVSDEIICDAFARIDSVRKNVTLSYFEFSTLAALDIFSRSQLDIQLLEVGLGGRLDAVNIVDADMTIVTSICIDHVDWLGETREAIGREKAGIFRPDVPAIIGDPEPPQSLIEVAQEKKSPIYRFGIDFNYQKNVDGWQWSGKEMIKPDLPEPVLKGEHQYRNASSVLMAVSLLQNQLVVSDSAIKKGLTSAELNGRFQLIKGDIPVLLDVAHNPQAVTSLHDYIQENFPDVTIHALFTMMQDKDMAAVIELIKDVIASWTIAAIDNSRVCNDEMIKASFLKNGIDDFSIGFASFKDSLAAVKQKARKGDLILIFGSFFLVSEFLADIKS